MDDTIIVLGSNSANVLEVEDEQLFPGQPVAVMNEQGTQVLGLKIGFGDAEHRMGNDVTGTPRVMPDSEYSKVPFLSTPWRVRGELTVTTNP